VGGRAPPTPSPTLHPTSLVAFHRNALLVSYFSTTHPFPHNPFIVLSVLTTVHGEKVSWYSKKPLVGGIFVDGGDVLYIFHKDLGELR